MNILVTVGTTAFDELVKAIDSIETEHEFILQISKKAKYKPKNHCYFAFSDEIDKYYSEADVVMTHSGAGSVYKLLELKKKIIIVPNLFRVDQHQSDLSDFMKNRHYAMVCDDIEHIEDVIDNVDDFVFNEYKYEPFFKADEILRLIVY